MIPPSRCICPRLMKRLGGIIQPLGGAVAYRRRHLKNLFDRYEPLCGDDLTCVEDVFIGLALANEGYRNIQLFDVTARHRSTGAHLLPLHAHRWAKSFLQGGHFFDALLRTPFKRLRNALSRGPDRLVTTGVEHPRMHEPVGGRAIGGGLGLAALERIWVPAAVLGLLLVGHGAAVAVILGVEAVLAIAVMTAMAPGHRLRMIAKGILTTPMRYGLMLTELYSMLGFVVRRALGHVGWSGLRASPARR